MKAARVTSNQVAARAGVSQSAVSRVFTPGASVSSRVVAEVRKAADELGYRPNVLARSLITGKSRIIGFIVAYLDNQFYPKSLQKLSEELQAIGYQMLIFTVDNRPAHVASTVQKLLDYQVDAIIAASVSMDTDLTNRCRNVGVPIVLYNRSQDEGAFASVTSDNVKGGRAIAHHFADIGVARPAYIAGFEGASTQRDREIGFRQGLKERGLSLFARGVGEFKSEQAQQAALKMFSSPKMSAENTPMLPDAIFVANDHMAFAVMDALRFDLGLKIPKDVCVAGYDDVPLASWPSYNLTTVRQPTNRMVAATIEAVLHALESPEAPHLQTVIEGPLMVRNSTSKPH